MATSRPDTAGRSSRCGRLRSQAICFDFTVVVQFENTCAIQLRVNARSTPVKFDESRARANQFVGQCHFPSGTRQANRRSLRAEAGTVRVDLTMRARSVKVRVNQCRGTARQVQGSDRAAQGACAPEPGPVSRGQGRCEMQSRCVRDGLKVLTFAPGPLQKPRFFKHLRHADGFC